MQEIRQAVLTDGYAVLPDRLPHPWPHRLTAGLDRLAEQHPHTKRLMPHEPFLELLASDLLHTMVAPVLGDRYLFHHANGRRLTDGAGKPWHQDYDSTTPWDGQPDTMMLHVMVYPAGLTRDNGPLYVRPGTHRRRVERHYPNRYGHRVLPADVLVAGEPGLVVLVNSALWHMRPPATGGQTRYYLNYSFIGPAPVPRPERDEYRDLLAELPTRLAERTQRERVSALSAQG